MQLPRVYYQHRELIDYVFFGGLTTVLNYIVYFFCLVFLHIDYLTSNVIAWILAVIFAFVTNKIFVFHSNDWHFVTAFRECWQFTSARIISVLVESFLLWLLVEKFFFDERIIKIFTNIVVIVLNYIFSKCFIFKHTS